MHYCILCNSKIYTSLLLPLFMLPVLLELYWVWQLPEFPDAEPPLNDHSTKWHQPRMSSIAKGGKWKTLLTFSALNDIPQNLLNIVL